MNKIKIDDFIKNHHHINYCEAIIYKDGSISYAIPSHVQALINYTGKDRNEINNIMPLDASPIHWLIEYTNAICVWTSGYIIPNNVTDTQLQSLQKLIDTKLVSNNKM